MTNPQLRPTRPTPRRKTGWRGLGLLPLIALAALVGVACSGGGDSGPTGSASIFVTDYPADDFVAINMTVSKVELRGGPDGHVTIFEGLHTFDLLALKEVSELLAFADGIPAGTYSKIRLTVEELELVEEVGEENGQPVYDYHYPKLPGNKKIDLLARGGFTVYEDEEMAVEIDFDMEKAIHIVHTGNKDKYNFRPVVFVRVLRNVSDSKLVRLHGVVRDPDTEMERFRLCRIERPEPFVDDGDGGLTSLDGSVADDDDGEPERDDDSVVDDDDGDEYCIPVKLAERGTIFDENGDPVDFDTVEDGDRATVIGLLRRDGDRRGLLAYLVLLGQRGTFQRLHGTVASEHDADLDNFVLALAAGQGYVEGTEILVQLFDDSWIFSRGGLPLDREHIALDLRASAIGVIELSNETEDAINTALLILDIEGFDRVKLEGELTEIELEGEGENQTGTLAVQPAEGDEVCVEAPSWVSVRAVGDGHSDELELADLEVGDPLVLYGHEEGECLVAHVILLIEDDESLDD